MEGTRAEMIKAARDFMMTPKVRQLPLDEQKSFLLSKGVTEQEIKEAQNSLPPLPTTGQSPLGYSYYPPPPVSASAIPPPNGFLALAQSAVIIGSIGYAGYKLIRSYVLPKFFDIADPATEETRRLQEQVAF